MAADWMLVKDLLETIRLAKEIYDDYTGERYAEIMEAIAKVQGRTAMRALREASQRTGQARQDKLAIALTCLEVEYTTQSWSAGDEPLARRHRWRHSQDSLDKVDELCQLALVTAAAYAALGNDERSVAECIERAQSLRGLWNSLHARGVWFDEPPPHGLTLVDLGTVAAEGNMTAAWRRRQRDPAIVGQELRERHSTQVDAAIAVIRNSTQPLSVKIVWGCWLA